MTLKIESSTAYFAGTSTGPPKGWGNTPWLNAPINITDWGSRAGAERVPRQRASRRKGVWNAAHYSNPKFDALVKSYLAAAELQGPERGRDRRCRRSCCTTRRWSSRTSTTTSPPARRAVKGYAADALGQIYLSKTSLGVRHESDALSRPGAARRRPGARPR